MLAAYGWVGLAVVASVAGDYFLKLAALRQVPMPSAPFLIGAALYVLTAVGWVLAMKTMTLGQIGVAYAILTMLCLLVMGVALFGEQVTAREALGVAFAVAALVLMSRFA